MSPAQRRDVAGVGRRERKQRRPGVDDVSIDAVDASGVAGVRYGALPAVGVALAGKVGDLHGLTRAFTSQLRPAAALTP
jgi:hypothetical protein